MFFLFGMLYYLKMHFQKEQPHMEEQKEKKQGGKRPGQKFKSLLVWNLLLKRTDESHAAGIKEI